MRKGDDLGRITEPDKESRTRNVPWKMPEPHGSGVLVKNPVMGRPSPAQSLSQGSEMAGQSLRG